MTELDILNNAIFNLKKEVPINCNWSTNASNMDFGIDGELEISLNTKQVLLLVEIKKDVKNHQLLKIINYKNEFPNFLLVAEKLFPKVKQELRTQNVNYLEGNGNVYLNYDDIFIYIENNKTLITKKDKRNRAFTKTGLKVIFHFLLDPQIINKTQREIAETTAVALGNIPLIINGLLDNNFISKLNKNEYIINDYEKLLNRWTTEFEQTLRPSIFKQRFRFQDKNQDWKDKKLNQDKTVWGGEPAGDILTNHLRPEKLVLYTLETTKDLLINYRLIPDDKGDVWVYDFFWNPQFSNNIAPIPLIYAELMIGTDKRRKETANLIFNERIKPNL